jgi:hypothetical protein
VKLLPAVREKLLAYWRVRQIFFRGDEAIDKIISAEESLSDLVTALIT